MSQCSTHRRIDSKNIKIILECTILKILLKIITIPICIHQDIYNLNLITIRDALFD